ncbi:MAG: hypothetical protein H3C30_16065 [Candidatus Hydrogenedentes bacterium]|nr:hypothetical protein [Candidatus Hydrogenedentota bacterium]
MPKTETKQTENILPAELHALAGRLAAVVAALPEAERNMQVYEKAFETDGSAWSKREAAAAEVRQLKAQAGELQAALASRLKSALKPTAEAPQTARAADREAIASATGEALQCLREAHGLLLKARELFTTDGGHTRALSSEVSTLARHLSERTAFESALPAHGPTIPNGVIMATHAVKDTLDIYQR